MTFSRTILLTQTSYSVLAPDTWSCLQNDFEVQVEQLIHNVSASKEHLKWLPKMLLAIEDTLNTIWPGSKVELFGSLSTGLGSTSSDADVAVMLPVDAYTSDTDVRLRAKAAFESSPHIYHNITTRSRLPAVTLYFTPAEIFCDINFKARATHFESDLLRYLLNTDERALKLGIIIKQWGKLHKLIRKKHLTSYGMMMLVVFFLQQRSMLPSVVELQNNVEAHILSGSDRYNVAFERKTIVSKNSESLYRLLGEFFEFYKDFDFDKYIVCPFTGQPIDRSVFNDLDAVPDEFYLYKRNVASNITKPLNITALCIQSLLVHSDNCAWRVDTSEWFKTNFENAAMLYREIDMCSFLSAIL